MRALSRGRCVFARKSWLMEQHPPSSAEAKPLDAGLRALSGIAAYYRIGADPLQLRRELALGDRASDEFDLIRAAQMIGLKARLVTGADQRRIGKVPTPAIVRLSNGAIYVFGGRGPSGLCRLVDPISHAATDLTLEDLTRETDGRVLLIARRVGGAGVNPRLFSALVLADAVALPQAARACARGVAVRSDLRADDAAHLPGDCRQGSDPPRIRDAVRHDRGPRRGRAVRRGAVISASLCAFAHHQPDRRRTRAASVRASPAPADELFRDPLRRPDRRPGSRTRDDPLLPDRTGAVLGD